MMEVLHMIDLNRKIDPQLELEINKITEQVENKQIPLKQYHPYKAKT